MCALKQHDFDLGAFGAPTQKPIWIYFPFEVDLEFPCHAVHHVHADEPPTAIVHFGFNNHIRSSSTFQPVSVVSWFSGTPILKVRERCKEDLGSSSPRLILHHLGRLCSSGGSPRGKCFLHKGTPDMFSIQFWFCLCVCICVCLCDCAYGRRSRRVSWLKESSNMDVHVLEARILEYCSSKSCNDCMMSHFAPLFQWCQHVVKK